VVQQKGIVDNPVICQPSPQIFISLFFILEKVDKMCKFKLLKYRCVFNENFENAVYRNTAYLWLSAYFWIYHLKHAAVALTYKNFKYM